MKIIAFGASTSSQSINARLASYAAGLMEGAEVEVEVLNLRDFDLPLFSEDLEREAGHPEPVHQFLAKIRGADALIISHAEHNGSFAAAYKNLVDWASRVDRPPFHNLPALLLSTSPGGRGGATVLAQAEQLAPFWGLEVVATLAVPSFHDNFDSDAEKLVDADLASTLNEAIDTLRETVISRRAAA